MKKILGIILILTMCFGFAACGGSESQEETYRFSSFSDFKTVRIALPVGSAIDTMIWKDLGTDVKLSYYQDFATEIEALKKGEVDAVCQEKLILRCFIGTGSDDYGIFPGVFSEDNHGFWFQKGDPLLDEFDTLIQKYLADGTVDEIYEKWATDTEAKVDWSQGGLAVNGKPEEGRKLISYYCYADAVPNSYVGDGGSFQGAEFEFLQLLCNELGYSLDIKMGTVDTIVFALTQGKADMVGGTITITPEREEQFDHTTPHYSGGFSFVCMKDDINPGAYETTEDPDLNSSDNSNDGPDNDKSFFESFVSGFEKTFVRESRWKLILEGLGTTILIAFLSGLFGTIIGFYLSLLKVLDKKPLNIIIKCYCNFFVKIPALVVLMLVFFVVFKNVDISATIASIITFSLMFSTNVYGEIATGISAVDKGQWEASTALGFSKGKTFRVIIIPQVLRIALPNFKSDFVSMMKLTSIVGYIAVQDLTKASDIIRARTYEPFFPLISIAVIYFLISTLLFYVFEKMELRVDFANKKPRLLKYVKTDVQISGGKTKHVQQEKGEIIRLEHIKKAYEQVTPLKDINISVSSGEIISIIGPSGTGKSTLLRMINGLETQSEGKVFVFGKDTEDYDTDMNMLRQKMGMVFQSFNLFNNLNVVENVMIGPMALKGVPAQEAYEKAMKALANVGMDGRAMNKPQVLSGGQKQRVAIARAVAMDPEIILFDEPTSALDPKMVDEVLNTIKDLSKSGITMLIVTHEMKFAREVSTRIIYLDQGEVYEDGTPQEIFETPKRNRTRVFVNNQKMLVFAIRDKEYDFSVAIGEIYAFCRKNGVKGDRSMRLCNLFEEMSGTGIIPGEEASHSLHVLIEYNNKTDQLSLRLIYEGPKWIEGDLELFESRSVFTYEAGRNTLIFENVE